MATAVCGGCENDGNDNNFRKDDDMSDDKTRWAAEWYRKGNDAMQKQNWGLAVESFSACAKLVPDNVVFRQLLRNCTKKKYNDNGKGAGMMSMLSMNSAKGKVKKAKAAEDWQTVDLACEEGLLINPWDTYLLVELGAASLKLDRGEVARSAYFDAAKAAPKDKAVVMAFAELLYDRGEFMEARKAFQMAKAADPNDLTLDKKINDCDVKDTEKKGKWDQAESTKDVMANPNAGMRGQTRYAPGEDKETDLRQLIRKEPERYENYVNLSDHLKQNKKFDDALEIMQKALELTGNDPNIREKVEDLELLVYEQNLSIAKERADDSGAAEDRKKVAEMVNELRQRRIEVLASREQRYPANMNIKYELAQLYMQLQKWPQAIPLLQRSSQDPRLKVKALVSLGKSFMYDKKIPLAKSQFERAVPDLDPNAAPETFLECHYWLARCAEALKDNGTAEKHFGEVLVVDYEYKDARERLEKLQTGGND